MLIKLHGVLGEQMVMVFGNVTGSVTYCSTDTGPGIRPEIVIDQQMAVSATRGCCGSTSGHVLPLLIPFSMWHAFSPRVCGANPLLVLLWRAFLGSYSCGLLSLFVLMGSAPTACVACVRVGSGGARATPESSGALRNPSGPPHFGLVPAIAAICRCDAWGMVSAL